jgi:phage gp36-like protein
VAYITNADIELRLGVSTFVQLTDDDDDGEADVAVVDEVRLAAEAEVNSFLAQRYAAPIDVAMLPELAALLKAVTLDVAEFRCRVRRPPVAEDARRLYERAREWLRWVASGVVQLPSLSAAPAAGTRGPAALSAGRPRVLTDGELDAV